MTDLPTSATRSPTADAAMDVVRMLSVQIGPRRPCSLAEREAGERLVEWLRARSVPATLQPFSGYSTFAAPYSAIFGLALAGGLMQLRRRRTGTALAATAVIAGLLESDLRRTPVSDAFARKSSANAIATIAATEEVQRRIVLVGHMDTSRSGLIFHPRVVRQLERLVGIPAFSMIALVGWPVLRRIPGGHAVRVAALAGLTVSLGLLAEREFRGQDVAGANDNASGAGVAAALAAQVAAQPFRHTQVDLLIAGCEESGILGSKAYVRADARSAGDPPPVFLNFDTVGGVDLPLTYIEAEGTARRMPASKRLMSALDRLAGQRPELTLRRAPNTPGLPTDATVALAYGHQAVTLLAQSEQGIPHYHWPTDTYDNVSADTVARTVEAGRELIARLDRDEAL